MSWITSIVLVTAEPAHIDTLARDLAQVDGVRETYLVAGGSPDIVAIIRTSTHDEIADLVTGVINKLDGVTRTETKIAFRRYSKEEEGAAFEAFGD
ncbi:MAG: Lrp/AsnC ligand binding domain-containing protein [Actinomycetota bacterium]|nr:Lrp/AsnC ligand binding domain-containing protein [Actinomycetota bacterium]